MILDKAIFREYDIRGIAGESITEEVVERIGKAYGSMIAEAGGTEVSVGYDCRKIFSLLSRRPLPRNKFNRRGRN